MFIFVIVKTAISLLFVKIIVVDKFVYVLLFKLVNKFLDNDILLEFVVICKIIFPPSNNLSISFNTIDVGVDVKFIVDIA